MLLQSVLLFLFGHAIKNRKRDSKVGWLITIIYFVFCLIGTFAWNIKLMLELEVTQPVFVSLSLTISLFFSILVGWYLKRKEKVLEKGVKELLKGWEGKMILLKKYLPQILTLIIIIFLFYSFSFNARKIALNETLKSSPNKKVVSQLQDEGNITEINDRANQIKFSYLLGFPID